mmetsp:Transcript_2365/g.6111  ORF Transcript_2365/g.6111 Transcript_2365/m.6111 type:complete len:83 (+) Transcript_2365:114-362(+)|eukprot:1161724-Pelagomonas_calceolata.AAC.3
MALFDELGIGQVAPSTAAMAALWHWVKSHLLWQPWQQLCQLQHRHTLAPKTDTLQQSASGLMLRQGMFSCGPGAGVSYRKSS